MLDYSITVKEIIQWGGLVLIFVVIPAWVVIGYRAGRRRQARIRSGICANCGYDVRGIADRCPECGEQITRYR
jgi:hypothetical protein